MAGRPHRLRAREAAAALTEQATILRDGGRFEEAVERCDRLIARFGTETAPEIRLRVAGAYSRRGYCLEMLGCRAEARANFRRLVEDFDRGEDAYVARSIDYAHGRLTELGPARVALRSARRYAKGAWWLLGLARVIAGYYARRRR